LLPTELLRTHLLRLLTQAGEAALPDFALKTASRDRVEAVFR
jgi:hypothetical protein